MDWSADTIVVGLLVVVSALPVITAAASACAGRTVLVEGDAGGSLVGRYFRAWKDVLLAGIKLLALVLPVLVVALVDVLWATATALTPLRTAVLGAGCLLAVLAGFTGLIATTMLDRGLTLRRLVREAAIAALAAPHRAFALLASVTAAFLLGSAVPLALPVVAGLVARLLAAQPHAEWVVVLPHARARTGR